MIFIEKMKNLKIYKTPMFLPTMEKDKKRKSVVLLMTPDYNSSKKLLDNSLFINRLRFASYYLDKDVSYYINGSTVEEVNESVIIERQNENVNDNISITENTEFQSYVTEISADERNKLPKSAFGIPDKRKYPLDNPNRVKSAIRFFNYVDKEDENLLAKNIIAAMRKYKMKASVGDKNRFKKYIPSTLLESVKIVEESKKKVFKNDKGEIVPEVCPKCGSPIKIFLKGEPVYLCTNKDCNKYFGVVPSNRTVKTESFLGSIPESVLNTGDKVIFFNEDAKNDAQLRRMLYLNRIKTRKEVVSLYDRVKADFPFIKYTYPDFDKYAQKNVFVDLYYYNAVFFENNTWVLNKGLNLYLDFMSRLILNPKFNKAGYKKKTVFIPVGDWDKNHSANVWNYRQNLNPLSLIYQLMYTNQVNRLAGMFKDINFVFIGANNYFKINFQELVENKEDLKKLSLKFKLFLIKMCKNEEFDPSDVDTTFDNTESKEVIKANIIDKIEASKGVDLTAQVANAGEEKKKAVNSTNSTVISSSPKNITVQTPTATKSIKKKQEDLKKEEDKSDKVISKGTLNQIDKGDQKKKEANIKTLAKAIDDVSDTASSEDDALDILDSDEIRSILIDLDSGGEDKVNISAGRAARITELDKKLMETQIKGRTVKDILSNNNEDSETKIPEIKLNLSTPNEEWNKLSYMNFDKNYDIDKDIISCFRFFENVSRPISITQINVEDDSTSEDRLELYSVKMEDYRGKRFTVELDIPIMVDNRFLLRGNSKSIQTQFHNMPIIKTDNDTCQIISNYMKIFVRRYGSGSGKSLPATSKFIKALNKYKGRNVKVQAGNNTKVCSKYDLPIDYIDIAGTVDTIETPDFIIYFNQDEIRKLYTIEEEKGIPFLYDKKDKAIEYISYEDNKEVIYTILNHFLDYNDFMEIFDSCTSPMICTYSRCSIMNSQIPLVVICGYHEGLRKTLEKANIKYILQSSLSREIRKDYTKDWIKFSDGYIVFDSTYEASLLLNGLKECATDTFTLADMDNRNMYLEFLDNFGGRIKADGLENFYDLMVDPITKEILEFYKFPTDYVSILLYANNLLADNKFFKHTDTSSRRIRRYELIAVYTYKVLADAYASYANQLKHSREAAEFNVKKSAVIDRFLLDTISSDDSCINALRDVETTNAITAKGPSGMNTDRAYSLDKRTYDESMLNVLGMSTGFSGNVGITRQATIDANIEGTRGFVKSINGNTEKMDSAKTLTITEALTPFGSTRDDPARTAMTFVQTAKHMVRTEESDPLLVTNGSDEAMLYLTTDRFAFKAKNDGKVIEFVEDEYMLVEYDDGTKDYINLKETIEKNSDGGYYVPLKLSSNVGIKIGTKFKANQILAYDKYSFSNSVGETDNPAYNIGKLAKVAILNSDEGFEDSGVITESMAEKLATRINLKFDIILDKNSNIFKMANVGDQVESGEELLIWQAPFDDEDANSLMKSLSGDDVSELGKRKLKSEVTGKVTDIKIFRTVEIDELSDSLKSIVDSYEKPLRELEKKLKDNNLDISQIPAHTILSPTGKLKKAQDSVLIEFYVEYIDTVGIGDKVVYFSANKAVEKNIIPRGKEPYTIFRPNEPVDAFVSEVSIDKRIVTSSIIYGSLQKLMVELDRSIKDIMDIPYDDSKV